MAYPPKKNWEGIPGRTQEQTSCYLGKRFGDSIYLKHGLEGFGIDAGYGRACCISPMDILSLVEDNERRKGRIGPIV